MTCKPILYVPMDRRKRPSSVEMPRTLNRASRDPGLRARLTVQMPWSLSFLGGIRARDRGGDRGIGAGWTVGPASLHDRGGEGLAVLHCSTGAGRPENQKKGEGMRSRGQGGEGWGKEDRGCKRRRPRRLLYLISVSVTGPCFRLVLVGPPQIIPPPPFLGVVAGRTFFLLHSLAGGRGWLEGVAAERADPRASAAPPLPPERGPNPEGPGESDHPQRTTARTAAGRPASRQPRARFAPTCSSLEAPRLGSPGSGAFSGTPLPSGP